jgi:hypothetical protein
LSELADGRNGTLRMGCPWSHAGGLECESAVEEYVLQKDRIDLVVQSMEVMARAAEANGQAEFDVDQFGRYK